MMLRQFGVALILFLAFVNGLLASPFHFSSDLFLRFDQQQFPQTPVPRERVNRYRLRWRPLLRYLPSPSVELGAEAEIDWTHESDEDVLPPDFPEFHTPVFDRDNFIRNGIVLSRAYVKYAPSPDFELLAGKFENPFLFSDLVWDNDLHPNGGAIGFALHTADDSFRLTLRGGDFYATSYLHDRTNVAVGQAVVQGTTGPVRLSGAVAYYFDDPNELAIALLRTNTRAGLDRLANGYHLLDVIGRVRFGFSVPLTAQIDYVKNLDADTFDPAVPGNGDSGYLAEAIIGKNAEPGDWFGQFGYHRVESDAVLAAYNTDDWWFPTRGEGYRIQTGAVIVRTLSARFSYLRQHLIGRSQILPRYQITFNIDWPR
jgi:Putative porin